MNKVLSFLNSCIMCRIGGRLASTRNKLYREEKLLLISQNNSNFNSLNRDKNIEGGGELSKSSSQIQTQYFSYKGGGGNLVAFSLNMGGVV